MAADVLQKFNQAQYGHPDLGYEHLSDNMLFAGQLNLYVVCFRELWIGTGPFQMQAWAATTKQRTECSPSTRFSACLVGPGLCSRTMEYPSCTMSTAQSVSRPTDFAGNTNVKFTYSSSWRSPDFAAFRHFVLRRMNVTSASADGGRRAHGRSESRFTVTLVQRSRQVNRVLESGPFDGDAFWFR